MTARLVLFLLACILRADDWSIERLFSRPFLWGTAPEQVTWSKQGHTLVFLWNADGKSFLDLYAYHPDRKKLVRLTALESLKDDLNLTEQEKDSRQRNYVAPPAGLSGFDVARDGSRVAFSYKGDLYIVATGGGSAPLRLTRTKADESSPQFSPDGKRLAYMRDRQIFVQDLGTGQLWQITDLEGETATGYRWSPDGRSIVYLLSKAPGRQVLLPNYAGQFVTARAYPRTVAGDEPDEVGLQVVSSEGGKPRDLETGPWGTRVYARLPEWSPDSKKLLLRILDARFKKQQLLAIDPQTGKATMVHEETDDRWVNPMFAAWSPDSQTLLFTSERDGFAHLFSGAGPRPAQQLTRGPWETSTETYSPTWFTAADPQWIGDRIYYTSTEAGTNERHLYGIRRDGSGKEKLSRREGINIGRVSEDGAHTAWIHADLSNPMDLYVDESRVTQSPRPEFYKMAWPETRFITFPSRGDKRQVAAKLLIPPGNPKSRPAVFFIHGSGYATSVLKQWGSYQALRYAFNCYLAHRGYLIMDMDYRGSSGYGRDWRTDVYLHMGGPDLDDVLGAVDYLKARGDVDMSRIGIWGVSYGGFMTNMAMFLAPGTFRAGASWAAVNDWENYNAFYTGQRLTTPRENPEAYRRSSPIHFSAMLKNPLLIVHGIVDNNVQFQDAVQLTEKLVHEGRDFSEIYYPEESHGFVRDETLIDAFRRTAEWFQQKLK